MPHYILVVDDDPAILDIVCWTLEDEGFATRRAMDGLEALDIIQNAPPDLLLLDLRMPRLNGWEVYRILTTDPHLQHIPIIIMTADQAAYARRHDMTSARFLAKPFNLPDLVNAVTQTLG